MSCASSEEPRDKLASEEKFILLINSVYENVLFKFKNNIDFGPLLYAINWQKISRFGIVYCKLTSYSYLVNS